MAGPAWKLLPQPIYQNNEARVIVLDLSRAMTATDLSPNRMTRAQYKILDILQQYPIGQTGMLVFSSAPFVVSPLTSDAATIASMVNTLSPSIMPVDGQQLTPALQKAAQLIHQAGLSHGNIILLGVNGITTESLALAKNLHTQGITISVLGIGTERTKNVPAFAQLDSTGLRKLAGVGGGRYANFTSDDSDLNALLNPTELQSVTQNTKKTDASAPLWKDEGGWLILIILPLATLVFRRGWLEDLVGRR